MVFDYFRNNLLKFQYNSKRAIEKIIFFHLFATLFEQNTGNAQLTLGDKRVDRGNIVMALLAVDYTYRKVCLGIRLAVRSVVLCVPSVLSSHSGISPPILPPEMISRNQFY